MTCPLVIAVETRLRADWESRADKSGLSKPKQAEFATLAKSMPFTAEPIAAYVAVDADTCGVGPDNVRSFRFDSSSDYEAFLTLLDTVTPDDGWQHRGAAGCRLIGRNIVDNMRIIAAGAVRAGMSHLLSSWMWYSHHFSPGVLVDPYLEFTDTDTRAVTPWSKFCNELGDQCVAPVGDAATRLTFELQQVARVATTLGLLRDQG